MVVTLTCSLGDSGSIPSLVTALSGHIGDWVICDPAISKERQHGTGSWVGRFISEDT